VMFEKEEKNVSMELYQEYLFRLQQL